MLYTGHKLQQPVAVRYPRGTGSGVALETNMQALEIGKSRTLRSGQGVALLNFGTLLPEAQKAAEQLGATLVDMRFVKPLDTDVISNLNKDHDLLVSIEDGAIAGGAGSAVGEFVLRNQMTAKLLQIGLPDEFIMQGTQQEMYRELKLDSDGIVAQVKGFQGSH